MGCSAKRVRLAQCDGRDSDEFEKDCNDPKDKDDLVNAALYTLWDVETAKSILAEIAAQPGRSVFAAIRSRWGHGLEIAKAVDEHIEGLYESGAGEPTGGDLFDMLEDTRHLAEQLFQAKEFDAAFFFAHTCAAMIRRCEGDEADDEESVAEWASALDELMQGAVKGWRAGSVKSLKQKKDAAIMVKLLEEGEKGEGCDQSKWYPKTLKELKNWAN